MTRYALARPNARSSHIQPTPQGGGAAIVIATLVVCGAAILASDLPAGPFISLAAAAAILAALGACDDVQPMPIVLRLAVQVFCIALVVLAGGANGAVFSSLVPHNAQLLVLIVAGLWFVNLTNFMDGLDWLTVAAMVPLSAALALFGAAGWVDELTMVVAACLLGALLGFAPFNRPVAKLFLGDVGALPIGLIIAWMLYVLASAGGAVAAIILPLYHLADATITVGLRILRRERFWQAHRTHFYQRATLNGMGVMEVAGHVFTLNCLLAVLAALTLVWPMRSVELAALALAALLVAGCLWRFSRGRPHSPV